MGRPNRTAPGGWIDHVLNRANAGMPTFTKDQDFIAFETVLVEAVARTGTRLLSYCLMGNRWHSGTAAEKELLSAWPIRRSPGWLEHVNAPQRDAELTAIRRSVNRGTPFGTETWAATATKSLGLEITISFVHVLLPFGPIRLHAGGSQVWKLRLPALLSCQTLAPSA